MLNYINVILIELLTEKRWSIILIKLLTTKSLSIILNELIGKYKHITSCLFTVTAYNINWIADRHKQCRTKAVCHDYRKYYILKIQIEVWTFQIWTHADRWRSCVDNFLKRKPNFIYLKFKLKFEHSKFERTGIDDVVA